MVTITNNTGEPLLLAEPQSNNRMFAAELKTNVLGKGYQLTVSTVPPLGTGSVQGQINLRTGSTNPPNMSVTAVANMHTGSHGDSVLRHAGGGTAGERGD